MTSHKSGNTTLIAIIAVGLLSLLTYLGLSANLYNSLPQADLYILPQQQVVTKDNTFTIDIMVSSDVAVNVFAGDITFDPKVLKIEKIDYNVSIADLWAERPWYHNGDGTLNFAGGTTKPGGFTGEGSLIKVTFKTLSTGSGDITIKEARILQHDGLGTDAILAPSIDAIVTINDVPQAQEVLSTSGSRTSYLVTEDKISTDLNGDGKQTMADTSIFMVHLAKQNLKADFNDDGTVNLADLSILMKVK